MKLNIEVETVMTYLFSWSPNSKKLQLRLMDEPAADIDVVCYCLEPPRANRNAWSASIGAGT